MPTTKNIPSNFPILILSVLLLGFLIAGCSGEEESGGRGENQGRNIPAVEAVEARYGSLPLSERLSGTVIAKNQVELYSEISGKIAEVMVENGQKVSKGAPLARIDDRQYREQVQRAEAGLKISEAELKQAQAGLNELESQYKRTKILSEKELSSDLEMERIKAQVESARADVELAEARVEQAESTLQEQRDLLQKTVIRSPINGSVGQRNAEMGMQVNANTPLFTVGDLDLLRIEVVLTENMLQRIEIGQTAKIYAGSSKSDSEVLTASLDRISPFLNTVTRSTEAEIDVENKDNLLRPGMFVAVDILYGESEQATIIPTSALYTDPNSGKEGVFVATSLGSEVEVVEDTTSEGPGTLSQPMDVQFRPLNVIAEGRMELGVTGIQPGSWVVTVGQDLLSQGRNQARVRTSTWERILSLQGLQRQDLLNRILKEQESTQSTL
jgi:RND family efflux transporter MFP subunit